MDYLHAPNSFNPNFPNPFSNDGTYSGYSCFSNTGTASIDLLTRRTKSGCWLVQYNERNYVEHLVDFIKYENSYGRVVILHSNIKINIDECVLASEKALIPDILVHSTSLESLNQIKIDNKLKSGSNRHELKQQRGHTIIKYLSEEPGEYSDYVMLGTINENTELIMAMIQNDSFDVSEIDLYKAGARIYLNAQKLHKSGLLVRDGVHAGKVFKEIDLNKYCLKIVSAEDFEHSNQWTPKSFKDACNYIVTSA